MKVVFYIYQVCTQAAAASVASHDASQKRSPLNDEEFWAPLQPAAKDTLGKGKSSAQRQVAVVYQEDSCIYATAPALAQQPPYFASAGC